LVAGAADTVQIRLTLASPQMAGMSLRNIAEIQDATDEDGNDQIDDDSDYNEEGNEPDSTDDTDNDNIDGDGQNGGDEDESDFEEVEILEFDLAIQKRLAVDQDRSVDPGDTVSYDLIVINQGDIAADNISVVDFIPEGMTLDMSFGNWVAVGAGTAVTDTFSVAGGDLAQAIAPGASATFQIQLVIDAPLDGGLTLRNIAELGDATDENGNPQDDNDSDSADPDNPDDIDDNDDDDIDGDGQNGGDEDESDFEDVITRFFDLALIKTLADGQSPNVEAGDTVAFNIRVVNQGMIAADNIRVSDYLPSQEDGFLFDPTLNPGWSVYAEINDTTYIDTILTDFNGEMALAPGDFVDVPVFLVVNPAMEATMPLTNVAEISDATDDNGNDVVDIDSPMDTLPGNDNFFEDNETDGNQLTGGDSDNSDPATIYVGGFDLALVKTLADGQSSTVSAGDEVVFNIEVINQGAITADNVVVVDYVPAGFLFDPALNPGWALNADGNPVDTLSIADGDLFEGGLEPGERTTVQITLTVAPEMFPDYAMGVVENADGVESGQVLVNEAEIVSATDQNGDEVTDIDSTPDDTQGNDGEIDDDDENGGGDTDGDGVIDDDEDDSDIAVVTVECYQDPGVDNTIQVCLGCDEATVTINLFESLAALPNIGGVFAEGALIFLDDENNPVDIDLSDPENVVIPGNLDRTRDYSITYTIAAVNDCPEMTSTITIDIIDIQNLSCTGFQNISLGEDCEAEITPDLILQGNLFCANSLEVVILTLSGDTLRDASGVATSTVSNDQVNQTLFVSLVDPQCENTCWGQITIEDKKRPEIECPDDADGFNGVDFICTDFDEIFQDQGVTYMGDAAPAFMTPTGVPVIDDNCTPLSELVVDFYDLEIPNANPQCNIRTILRTFTVTDQSGNTATCVQQITVRPPTLADVNLPDVSEPMEISCATTYDALPNGNPVPMASGEPTITTAFGTYSIPGNAAYCNIAAGFEDSERIVTCLNTFKFVRTYTIFDWCDPSGDALTYSKVIKVGDFDAPVFTAPVNLDNDGNPVAGPLSYGTNAGDECAAYIRLDDIRITLTDDCSANIQLSAAIYLNGDLDSAPVGSFFLDLDNASPELSTAIPVGDHIIRYTYVDDCGNIGETDVDIRVEDLTPPVAICEDGLNISITGDDSNGFAVLTPDMLDAGSYDDCCEITLAIARVGDNDLPLAGQVYSDEIVLECDDAGIVRVGLRATDCNGNENFCWLDVLVEDKLAPSCVAPANMTITCVDYNASLPNDITEATETQLDAIFGQAGGADNCSTTVTQTVSGTINSCGVGQITRRFISTDGAGFTNTNSCVQAIDVIGIHDYQITFPTDEEGDCMEIPAFDGVIADEIACDLITTTVDVDTLRTLDAGEECFKLRVTYDVVNWCEYNSLGEPYLIARDAPGARDRTRSARNVEEDLLYVNVTPGPTTASIDDDVAFYSLISTDRVFNPAPSPQRDVALGDNGEGDANDDDTYGTNVYNSRGFFRYVQFIKIYDEVAPEITFEEPAECFAGSGEGCLATVNLEYTVTDECSTPTSDVELDANFVVANGFQPDNATALGITINVVVDEETGTRTLTATNVPVGEHAIRISANDGCGNTDVQIIEFCVTADRTPTPICIQTITVVLMDDGDGGGIAAIWAPDFVASPIIDCNGNVVDDYSIYRSSEAGTAGFTPAVGNLGVDDITCSDVGNLSVRVYAFDDLGSTPDFCEVVVEVQDNAGHCEGSMGSLSGLIATQNDEVVEGVQINLTSSNGMDEVQTTAANGTYSFTGLPLNADYTVQPEFNAAFNAQNIRASDLVTGIGQILGTSPFSSPYQFVAADVNQDGSFDVFDILAGQRAILGLDDGFAGGNWFMVEAGYEVNVSNPYAVAFPEVFNANDLQGSITADFVAVEKMNLTGATGRVAQMLNVDDVQLESGQIRTIILDGTHTAGFQGTIELAAGLELLSADLIGEGGMNLNRAGEGLIAVLVRESGSVSLEVRATTSGLVSELISLNDEVTIREGVALNGTSNALGLAFNEDVLEVADYKLLQNVPNPIRTETMIGYELPKAHAEVVIAITDAAGRLVREVRQEGVIGFNSVRLTKRQLGNTSGVFFYTVTAGEWVATKRMVVVE
jgi:uncharacterized repeat protein (TIGR01451 family)